MKLNCCPEFTARFRYCIFCFDVFSYACFCLYRMSPGMGPYSSADFIASQAARPGRCLYRM